MEKFLAYPLRGLKVVWPEVDVVCFCQMVQLVDEELLQEQNDEALKAQVAESLPPTPALDLEMPRLFTQPAKPLRFCRKSSSVNKVLRSAKTAHEMSDAPGFGRAYGELCSLFQPALSWAYECWDYLLSKQGCRFLARTEPEKLYSRGDYRVVTERDYNRLIYRSFKECLLIFLAENPPQPFEFYLRQKLWEKILSNYAALENPSDSNQRKLTGYSYLRCVPYQFLNGYHHERVLQTVKGLPSPLRQAIEMYHFRFYTEEAACSKGKMEPETFRTRLIAALRRIARSDYLSYVLLRQIERY